MRYALLIVAGALVACSSSSKNDDIAPDGTLIEGGKVIQTPTPAPTNTTLATPSPKPASGYESGTRIKTKTFTGTDGSKQFAGYYDSERKEDCSFTGGGDGKIRCMPSSAGVSLYSDSSCSTPVLNVSTTPPTCGAAPPLPSYITVPNPQPDVCTYSGSRLYRRGNSYSGPIYYKLGNGCQSYPAASSFSYYSLGEEILSTSFVEATIQID